MTCFVDFEIDEDDKWQKKMGWNEILKKQPKDKAMKKQIKENKTQYILDEKELERLLKNSVSWEVAEYCRAVDNIQSSERYDEFFEEDRERTGNSSYGIDEYVKEWIEEWIEEIEKK